MKIIKPVDDIVVKMRDYFAPSSYEFKNEDPFRLELLSNAQMESLGKHVAGEHQVAQTDETGKVLKRLDNNEDIIVKVQQLLTESVSRKQTLPTCPGNKSSKKSDLIFS